ncbi:MAG: CocE/NonD family hydrolase [Dehalococcoidia bacterium]|jgi:hypothetical protein|nr:CocE/NonD family hydrolase [Dehalococcoidia bacterium]
MVTSAAIIELNVAIEMRDGVTLHADVYRPGGEDPCPVILQRTPYDKRGAAAVNVLMAVERGYAIVLQDVRGRFQSGGAFDTFVNEANDGYDTVEWIAEQPWSNGKIGMIGASYVGATQWLAASAKPPHLTAIFPRVTASDYHEGWTYQGGVFELGFNVSWGIRLAAANARHLGDELDLSDERVAELARTVDDIDDAFWTLPLDQQPFMNAQTSPYFFDWLNHPAEDGFWSGIRIEDKHHDIQTPAYNLGGWYDIFLMGTLRNYVNMRENGGSDEASAGQKLIIGPWSHSSIGQNVVGDEDFTHQATAVGVNLDELTLRWYDHWLKGEDNGIIDEPPVKIFVMGENEWRDENEWPLARAERTRYYLHSDGRAHSPSEHGVLSVEPPTDERPDVYLYDPQAPVSTLGGPLCCGGVPLPDGPKNHAEKEERADILVYSTPELEKDVEVTGPVTVSLWASTSAADTDFTGMLLDVRPCGCAVNLTDGIVRARYQDSRKRPHHVDPNLPKRFDIDLVATSNVFKKGHRIRLEISSSNFPRFARNLNTGLWADNDEIAVATNTVFHDSHHESYLELDIIPR